MTKLTVSDVFQRAQITFGDESGIQLTGEKVLIWVNDAQKEACHQIPNLLPKSITMDAVADQLRYTMPEDLFTLWGIKYTDSTQQSYYQVSYMSPFNFFQQFDGWDGTAYKSGIPSYFTRENNQIILFPPPQQDVSNGIQILYARYPVKLVSESDPIDLPEYLDEYVIDFVMNHAYEMDEDWGAADRTAQRLQSILNANKSTPEDRLHSGTYPTIGTTWEDSNANAI